MAYDLTLTTPSYNASGWSGQSLNGGYGLLPIASFPDGSWSALQNGLTLEARVKTTTTGSIRVAAGSGGSMWIGMWSDGKARAQWGYPTDVVLSTTVSINDGAWHHLQLCVDNSTNQARFFVDGVLAASSTTASTFQATRGLAVRTFNEGATEAPTSTYTWVGDVDEVALWTIVKNTASFTPEPVPNTATGLLAIWRFEGNGLNSEGSTPAATAVTLTGPTAGTVGVASTNFTIGANGAITGTVTVTPSSGGGGGTFSPASVAISSGAPTATFTYTPASSGAKTISVTNDGGLANPSSITYTASPAVNNAYNKDQILWSPYNWNVQMTYGAAVNAGAYFRTEFGGAACTLAFDVAGLGSPVPQIMYRIDGVGPWAVVNVAATVVLTMPSETASFQNHLLEVMIKATSETPSRWDGASNVVKLTGINLDATKVLAKPESLPLFGLFFGDSITEGINTIGSSGDTTVRSHAGYAWSLEAARLLGAEAGNVGFGRQGLSITGNGSVPAFGSTYNLIYAGVSRMFDPEPDFIVINQGTNDGATNITSAYTAALNGILAATETAVIFAMRPFNGTTQAANIQAAIAACSNPARVVYVDTAGWYNTANSFDTTHPNGFEDLTNLAPRLANVIRPVVHPIRGQRIARSISLSLVTGGSPAASLSGLKWAFFDQATPDNLGIPADQGEVETTDASGVLSINVYTTLPSGGVGWLIVTDSDGTTTQSPAHKAFSGPVQVT